MNEIYHETLTLRSPETKEHYPSPDATISLGANYNGSIRLQRSDGDSMSLWLPDWVALAHAILAYDMRLKQEADYE